jgi:hypothetical protein
MNSQQIAKRALERYSLNDTCNLFTADGATIFYAGADGQVYTAIMHADVYEGLRQMANLAEALPEVRYVGIVTTGWAAPTNPDGETACAPSEHPARRRCLLITVVDHNLDIGSVLGFEDDPRDLIEDAGVGTGPLADEMKSTMAVIRFHFLTSN